MTVSAVRRAWDSDALRRAMVLYAVTDSTWLEGRTLASCVQEAVSGGATFVQLREKSATTDELVALARPLQAICRAANVPFVIDDDIEAARRCGADGVHVGQSDAACAEARAALGPDAVIGVSVQTVDQAREAVAAGADYLGVGAMVPTPTKPDARVVAKDELRHICDAVSVPVVAIGGINAQTVGELRGTGVDGIAVVSGIFAAQDILAASRELAFLSRGMIGRAKL